jgi:hypothetical protein
MILLLRPACLVAPNGNVVAFHPRAPSLLLHLDLAPFT